MVNAHSRPRQIAFTEESSFGEVQTDFDNNGELFLVLDPNVEGLKQEAVENNNSVTRPLGKHPMLRGLKSKGTFSFGMYLHGNPATAASGSQASNYHIAKLLQNAMGGQQRSYHYGLTAGTTSSFEVADATGLEVGQWVWLHDQTTSKAHPRKITDVTGLVVSIKPPLLTAASGSYDGGGDIAYAGINVYCDQDSLTDQADLQHKTAGFYIKGEDDDDSYAVRGGKLAATIAPLEPGAATMVTFEGMVADFDNSGLSAPSMSGSVSGEAPLCVSTGDDTICLLGPHGGTLEEVIMFSAEPNIGITHQHVPNIGGIEGVAHYNLAAAPGETGLTIQTLYSSSYAEAFENDTRYEALIQVGTAPGKSFALYCPHLEMVEDPARSVSADKVASTLVFRAHEDSADVSGLSGDSKQSILSPIEIILMG